MAQAHKRPISSSKKSIHSLCHFSKSLLPLGSVSMLSQGKMPSMNQQANKLNKIYMRLPGKKQIFAIAKMQNSQSRDVHMILCQMPKKVATRMEYCYENRHNQLPPGQPDVYNKHTFAFCLTNCFIISSTTSCCHIPTGKSAYCIENLFIP